MLSLLFGQYSVVKLIPEEAFAVFHRISILIVVDGIVYISKNEHIFKAKILSALHSHNIKIFATHLNIVPPRRDLKTKKP